MKDRLDKVIGYFAFRIGSMNIVCDGDACLIADSEGALRGYISKLMGEGVTGYRIKKTRYEEIIQGMRLGGVYAFDEGAYNRFLKVAKADGSKMVEFKPENDPGPHRDAVRLMRVKRIDIT
jgi:hypothetical protein